jgi:hypothetical protein
LLQGLAQRFGRRIQVLQIRHRQTRSLLSTIPYIDLHFDGAEPLRLFACDVDAALPQKQALSRSLLAFSSLAVLVIGDHSGRSIANNLESWRYQMHQEPWLNRHALVMPLSATSAAVTRNAQFARSTHVSVRVTPVALSIEEAWRYISGAWLRVFPQGDSPMEITSGFIGLDPSPEPAPTGTAARAENPLLMRREAHVEPLSPPPLPKRPESLAAASRPELAPPPMARSREESQLLSEHAKRILELEGVVAVSLFDANTGLSVAQAGGARFADHLAQQGMLLASTASHSARTLGCCEAALDVTVQWADKFLVLRHVPNRPHLAAAALVDSSRTHTVQLRTGWLGVDALLGQ